MNNNLNLNDFTTNMISEDYCNQSFCHQSFDDMSIPQQPKTTETKLLALSIQFTRFNMGKDKNKFKEETCRAKKVTFINSSFKCRPVAGCCILTYPDYTIIVFTGTYNKTTADVDIEFEQIPAWNITNGCMHKGFKEYYDGMSCQIQNYFLSNKPANIYCTGISLGGAIASICSYSLSSINIESKTITFASPRVFNPRASNHINKHGSKITRIENSSDIVPTLPPSIVPTGNDTGIYYQHVGISSCFTKNWYSYYFNHVLAYAIHFNLIKV